MENLTPITLPQLDVEALAERAATIRDAINAKSVSAQQVGALFYDLVECCGNVRDALSLFINSNLPEIQQDIDRRLAGVDSAVEKQPQNCRSQKQHVRWWNPWWLRCRLRTLPHLSASTFAAARVP